MIFPDSAVNFRTKKNRQISESIVAVDQCYMCVCMFVCMYVSMHACLHVLKYVSVLVCNLVYVCVCVFMNARAYSFRF